MCMVARSFQWMSKFATIVIKIMKADADVSRYGIAAWLRLTSKYVLKSYLRRTF